MLVIGKKGQKIMKKTTFLIVGKHAVTEALKNPSRKIERIFLTEDAMKKLNRENQHLNLLKNINIFFNESFINTFISTADQTILNRIIGF